MRLNRTIMEIAQACIITRNIDDNNWPDMILAIIHIKNIRHINPLNGKFPHNLQFIMVLNVIYLRVLGFIVYIFINEEKQNLKS